MRILFDAQQLTERMTGVGYYSDRLLRAILKADQQHDWLVLCHARNARYVGTLVTGHSAARMVMLQDPVSLDYRIQQNMLSELLPGQHADLYFSPSFLSAPKEVCPSISVIHDVTYVFFPEFQPRGIAEYLHRCVGNTCGNAQRIIAVSENSKRDIARIYRYPGKNITVVHEAAEEAFFKNYSSEEIHNVRKRHNLPDKYLLAVNMGNPKKNAETLLAAYAALSPELKAEFKLVIVGEWSPDALDLQTLSKRFGCDNDLFLTGHVPREDLYCIYAGATLFCFPSFHEGFGLPVLEAMASGIPVICSDAASLPEVAGNAARLLNPKDSDGWATAMQGFLSDESLRAEFSERGKVHAAQFSWERAAQSTLATLTEFIPSEQPEHRIAVQTAPRFEPIVARGLTCSITVDDVRPESGFGGEREKGPIGYLLRLYEEFGCKSTLFIPTNWQGHCPLVESLDWLRWILEQPCFEVACHGHFHAVAPGNRDAREFGGMSPAKLEERLKQSLAVFAQTDFRPRGIKAPGWALEETAYDILDKHFAYVADHVQGIELAHLKSGSLKRVPYFCTIDDMVAWPDEGHIVLQSHIANERRTANGWTEHMYKRVRAFLKTGARLGTRFGTLEEVVSGTEEQTTISIRKASTLRLPEKDTRLRGGQLKLCGNDAGVLYHASGAPCSIELGPDNAAVVILSRNRRDYLAALLESIDATGPQELERFVLLNNCMDESARMLAHRFPRWKVVYFNDKDFPAEAPGLTWLKENMPELLPQPVQKLCPKHGWSAPRSIAWLRNRQFAVSKREFLLSFDDDFVVKRGWWEYYVRFQHEFAAHAVINNFGAFAMCKSVPQEIGRYDERFLGSHGFEDNDYSARMSEANIRWVLGFNRNHDWRSAEEGNPRGSMTGSDCFVHRYALMSGGYSARRDYAQQDPIRAAWNERWFATKWEETTKDTGIVTRPPFRGKFLKRRIHEEPDWLQSESMNVPSSKPVRRAKVSENTPVDEIDPIAKPATGTMIDRYVFASHWCKGKRVLDVACGYGYGSTILLALGARQVIGTDADSRALEYAQSRYAGPNLDFRPCNLIDGDPGTLETFDVVVSIETMEHLPHESVETYLGRLKNYVCPGGTVFLTTPRRIAPEWHYQGGTHRYEYSPEEFKHLLEKTFPGTRIEFMGIDEFRVHGEPRLYSRLTASMESDTRIMVAVVTGVQ